MVNHAFLPVVSESISPSVGHTRAETETKGKFSQMQIQESQNQELKLKRESSDFCSATSRPNGLGQ